MNLGILGSVKSLEVCGFVYGNVSVDCHEDDDVDRAGHEGVDERQLEMRLIECNGVGVGVESTGERVERRNGSDKNT